MNTLINAQDVIAVLDEKNVDYSVSYDDDFEIIEIRMNVVLGLANRSVVFDGSPVNKERLIRKIDTLLAEQKEMLENPTQYNSIEDEF